MGIPKDKIKFLSFEGGGGKGNAYVGALIALEEIGIIQQTQHRLSGQVQELSGASAGAITALLVGSGYSAKELSLILPTVNFDLFFDLPKKGEQVTLGKALGV